MGARTIFFIALIFIGGLMISTAGADKVIVTFTEKAHSEMITPCGKVTHSYINIPAVAADLPKQAIENLKKNDKIKSIEPDVEVTALCQTTPWGITKIGAISVQKSGNKGAGANIALIDTGINYNHPDLKSNYKGGYDFVNNDADPLDDNGHGTHCAGIIAASDNKIGVIGVAPLANLYSLKVLNSSGRGYVSNVIAAIDWVIEYNKVHDTPDDIQIISMSLGSTTDVSALQSECYQAYTSGILLVAAAGNKGNPSGTGDNVIYPANYIDSVIAVAATDSNNIRASFSSTGPAVELAAPGVGIYSTYKNGYYTLSGTSMACPHVAGTAALVIKAHPDWSNEYVRRTLDNAATDLGTTGRDNLYGFGLVNAYDAAKAHEFSKIHYIKC